MTSDELSELERFLLLQIAEANEELQQLVSYVHQAFPAPQRTIYALYQLVCETLEGLRERGLAKLIKVSYVKAGPRSYAILAQEDVPAADVFGIIHDPRCWDRSTVFDEQHTRYFYDTTEAGERALDLDGGQGAPD